jgi:Spy/CpxP family protein refolding chaperone
MREKTFNWKWMALLAVPAVLLFVAGCAEDDDAGDEGASGGAAVADEAAVAGDAELDKSRMGKHRRDGKGPHGKMGRHKKSYSPAAKLLRYALKELDLTDEQRATLEGLRDPEQDDKGAKRRGDRGDAYHEVMVQALETGKLDRAALEAKLAAKDEKIAEKIEQRNAKLATLHATLSPEQRQTLAEAVRAKMEQKADKRDDKRGDKRDRKRGDKRKGKRGHRGKLMFHGMLDELELTAEQRAQIDALKAKAEAQHPTADDLDDKKQQKLDELRTLLDAFVNDDFDPVQSAPKPAPMKDSKDKIDFHIEQFEALLGILTADQRAQLAEKIKSHPGKVWHGKGMKGPGCNGMKGGERPADCPRNRHPDCPYADGAK